MYLNCQRCNRNEIIKVPEFSDSEKQTIHSLIIHSAIKAIQFLSETYKITLKEAKFIVSHINLEFGKCQRCNFENLIEEYKECPKCKAMNFNWKNL